MMNEIPNGSPAEAVKHSRHCPIDGAICLVRDVYQYRVVSRPVYGYRRGDDWASVGGYRTLIWDMDGPPHERRLVFKSEALVESHAEAVWYGTAVVCHHVECGEGADPAGLP